MFKKIILVLAVIVIAFLGYVAIQPSDFYVAREIKVNALPKVIFEQVNNLHKFEVWNPWAKLDPNAKQAFDGPVSGVGAISNWEGNKDVGSGRMTIVESQPNSLVRMKLEMFKPMKATNSAEFTFKPEGNQTVVTWSVSGHSGFLSKIFCVFINRDKIIGEQFDKGLADLKKISESAK